MYRRSCVLATLILSLIFPKTPLTLISKASPKKSEKKFNIDFPEPTSVRHLIKAIAEWTGKNIVLNAKINKQIQIISPTGISMDELWEVFLTALNVAGYTVIDEGKILKVVPKRNPFKEKLPVYKKKYISS